MSRRGYSGFWRDPQESCPGERSEQWKPKDRDTAALKGSSKFSWEVTGWGWSHEEQRQGHGNRQDGRDHRRFQRDWITGNYRTGQRERLAPRGLSGKAWPRALIGGRAEAH